MNLHDRQIVAGAIARMAERAKRELFAPIKPKGNYAERLRQHFAAKARQCPSERTHMEKP